MTVNGCDSSNGDNMRIKQYFHLFKTDPIIMGDIYSKYIYLQIWRLNVLLLWKNVGETSGCKFFLKQMTMVDLIC